MQIETRYPEAILHPSTIEHPRAAARWGVCIHWTAGREPGDVATLDGPNVDCHFYVTKAGEVYQFLDPWSVAWHAYPTANATCIGIEHEGSGEAWTEEQFAATVALNAWLARLLNIPVRHVDPSAGQPATFKGWFGHRDLSVGGMRVDGNNHTDSVPDATGWDRFIEALRQAAADEEPAEVPPLEGGATLRLVVGLEPNRRKFSGWENAAGPIRWLALKGDAELDDPEPILTWQGERHEGKREVVNVAKNLYRRFLEGHR
jgi:hypothetical protein